MKNTIKNILQKNLLRKAFILLSALCFFSAVGVYALSDYTTLAPLPGTTGCDNTQLDGTKYDCTTDFQTYLPALFNLSIGIAAALAFIMISYGGFELMTTDSILKKTEGRKKVENAIWGLLLVIGAYAILYTINPQILNFNLNINSPNYASLPGVGSSGTNGVVSTGGVVASKNGDVSVQRTAGINVGDCSTCQQLTKDFGIPTNTSANGTGVTPDFGNKLKNLNSQLTTDNDSLTVTEGWPPTVNHDDGCHASGTCVDATIANPTPANIITFFKDAKTANMNASYEVKTQAQLDALRAAGVPIAIPSTSCIGNGTACINPGSVGNGHFHLK